MPKENKFFDRLETFFVLWENISKLNIYKSLKITTTKSHNNLSPERAKHFHI